MHNIILSTANDVPGRTVKEVVGIARGNTVRARHVGRDITAMFKNIVGGEISEYTKLQADAREQAMQRMVQDAERHGADAIIAMRIETSIVTNGAAEIVAYGTAVKLR